MFKLLVFSVFMSLIVIASPVAAVCNGLFSTYLPLTPSGTQNPYLFNFSFNGEQQFVWTNNNNDAVCYNATAYAIYDDDVAGAFSVEFGNETSVGNPWGIEWNFVVYLENSSTIDRSVYSRDIMTLGSLSNVAGPYARAVDFPGGGTLGRYRMIGPVINHPQGCITTLVNIDGFASQWGALFGDQDSNGVLAWYDPNSNNYKSIYRGGDINHADPAFGAWNVLEECWNGTGGYVYQNGNLLGTRIAAGGVTTATNFYLGGWLDNTSANRGTDGKIAFTSVNNGTVNNSDRVGFTNMLLYNNYTTVGAPVSITAPNITTTLSVTPGTLYNLTDANFSLFYNDSSLLSANITINVTVNGANISDPGTVTFTNVTANSTIYFYVESENYSKHHNITFLINLTTYTNLETATANITREIQNSLPVVNNVTWLYRSVIIGDTFNATAAATDGDGDSITYWYIYGWNNGTNITSLANTAEITVNASDENVTFRVYAWANDGEANGTINVTDMNVTRIAILWPSNNGQYYGKTFNYSFNFVAQTTQPCTESIDATDYSLGNISTGEINNSRYVWYGNHTYNVSCGSLQDATRTYYKTVNYSNYYASWNVSIYTENEWDTPLNITSANLSIIIDCVGGETYVYNFTGIIINYVNPACDVETVSAKVDYATDSYLRQRTPPCSGVCEVRLYMVDALIYTVLQIPIYMSDYQYYNHKIELYKTSGGNHYTIAEGYFDVERKYVTYLTKDNTYYIRLERDGVIRDIGFLYAATATSQYLSLSEINLEPDITLISDNLLMAAEFDNLSAATSVLRIMYQDLINMTESVRIRIFSMSNNTAWYDNTVVGSSNFTISLNNVPTTRHSVHFTVEHAVLGNSPVDYTTGVGGFAGWDLGLATEMYWLYTGFAFFVIMITTWVIPPENRLPGYLLLLAELGIFAVGAWLVFEDESIALFISFVVAGILYEIRHKGIS